MTARLYDAIATDINGLIANVNESELTNMNIALVSSAYTPNFATHIDRDDLSGVLATGGNVGTVTRGADGLISIASPYPIPSVPAGTDIAAWVLVENTGVSANDRLVYYNNESTGLPLTPDGNNVDLTMPSGLFRIRGTV